MRHPRGSQRAWCAALLALATVLGGPAQAPGSDADRTAITGAAAATGTPHEVPDPAPSAGRTPPWEWPTDSFSAVARPFDPPAQRWLAGHRGIDLVGLLGEPVRAVDQGTVTFSGEVAGVGVVSVTHADGLRSTYQPVADRALEGVRVARGEQIGVLDAGGHCLLLHCLHLGAVRGRGQYLDPSLLLGQVRLTLLPSALPPAGT